MKTFRRVTVVLACVSAFVASHAPSAAAEPLDSVAPRFDVAGTVGTPHGSLAPTDTRIEGTAFVVKPVSSNSPNVARLINSQNALKVYVTPATKFFRQPVGGTTFEPSTFADTVKTGYAIEVAGFIAPSPTQVGPDRPTAAAVYAIATEKRSVDVRVGFTAVSTSRECNLDDYCMTVFDGVSTGPDLPGATIRLRTNCVLDYFFIYVGDAAWTLTDVLGNSITGGAYTDGDVTLTQQVLLANMYAYATGGTGAYTGADSSDGVLTWANCDLSPGPATGLLQLTVLLP